MLQMLTFTGSIFVLETNIYNKYEMHIYNKNLGCRYDMFLYTLRIRCKLVYI